MGFFWTCVYVVFVLLRPQEWLLPPWSRSLQLVDIVCGLAALGLLADLQSRRSRWLEREDWVEWLLLGLFAMVVLSNLADFFLAASLNAFAVFGKIVVLFFLVTMGTSSLRRFRILARLYVGCCLLVALHCLMQSQLGFGFAGQAPSLRGAIVAGQYLRLPQAQYFGIFADPNDTALLLVSAIPLLLLGAWRGGWGGRLWAGAGVCWLAGGVYATQSRSGYLALLATLALFFLVKLNPRMLLAAVVVGVIVTMVGLPARMASGTGDYSARSRMDYWVSVNRAFKQRPIFGVGFGRIQNYVERGMVPHNSFVHTYGELGIAGFTCWLGLLVVSFLLAHRILRLEPEDDDDRELKEYARALLAALGGFVVSTYFISRPYALNFFLLIALLAALFRLVRDRLPEGSWRLPASVVAVLVALAAPLAILLIYISIPLLRAAL